MGRGWHRDPQRCSFRHLPTAGWGTMGMHPQSLQKGSSSSGELPIAAAPPTPPSQRRSRRDYPAKELCGRGKRRRLQDFALGRGRMCVISPQAEPRPRSRLLTWGGTVGAVPRTVRSHGRCGPTVGAVPRSVRSHGRCGPTASSPPSSGGRCRWASL